MHLLKAYGDNIYLFTHKKEFVNNTDIYADDKVDAFNFAYDMTFGGKGAHRKHRSGGKKHRSNAEIFVDAFQGKIAEYGFYNFFIQNGSNITRPDIDTLPLSKWDSFDFCINDFEIAVKSTKEYGNLLLLETKDWNEKGCYIPNIEAGHAEYDYFVLIRVKSELNEIMKANNWDKTNFVSKELLNEKTKNITWHVNIAGFITKEEFVNEVIRERMVLEQDSKLGTVPHKTTCMDASNYYVQAGDLHEIDHLVIEVVKEKESIRYMDKIDIKKLDVSIEYIKRMAEGKNPINNEAMEADSILNNPNVIRCLYYVEGILKMVKEQEESCVSEQCFPIEHLKKYEYRRDLSISHFVNQLNEGLDEKKFKKLKYDKITSWLKLAGYLEVIGVENPDKKRTVPTLKGRKFGIYTEERDAKQGRKYSVVMYNRNAQQFIIDNMEKILDGLVV